VRAPDRRAHASGVGRRFVLGLAAAGVIAVAGTALSPRAPAQPKSEPRLMEPYANDLPAGGAHDIAGRACLLCHSPTLITQQHKDSAGWEKTIVQMEKWGAPLTPGEHDSLRGYLLAHYGPKRR
jgi:cytochrome c5